MSLNEFLENTPDYYLTLDSQLIVRELSRSLSDKFDQNLILGRYIGDIFTPTDEEIQELILNNKSIPLEVQFKFVPIRNVFQLSSTPMGDTLILQLKDISELKFQEEIIRDIEEVGKIGYWLVEQGSEKPWWSRGTYKIHGVPPEKEMSFDINEAINFYEGESKDRIIKDFGASLNEGKPYDDIYQIRNALGELLHVRVAAKTTGYGDTRKVYGVFQDVTSQIEDQLAVASIENRLSSHYLHPGIGVWEYDLRDQSLIWDQHMYRIYGISEESFPGAYEAWSNGLHPDDREEAEKAVETSSRTGQAFDSNFRVVWPDGTVRHVKAKAKIVTDDSGNNIKMIGVNWDVTESILQEQELLTAKEAAENALSAKSSFLSNMSHEIRTPMNGILGFLELLEDTELDDEQKQYLNTISKSSKALLALINDILDYSKIESGHLSIKPTYIDLHSLISELMDIFKPLVSQKTLLLS